MKFTIISQCLALLIFLDLPTPILPDTPNDTYLEDMEPEPFLYVLGRKRLMEAQYKCYDRMAQSPPYEGEGPYCNRTWDGWMCWDDTPAGVMLSATCPDYFPDFDSSEKVTKYCDENGDWFKHPENNQTWSNYTLCNAFTPEKLKNAYVLYYLAIVGHSLSIFTLVISLGIFLYFKTLGCHRVTLHKNMFLTYVLNSTIIIIHLVEVVPNGELVRRDPVNFFFLLNIVRVLVIKMRQNREAESHMYLKAVRATLFLVPLLGIQFVVFPWRPSNKVLGKIYDYLMHSLIHFQGFFVASIYCFWNNEVQTTVKRHWVQFKIEWNQRWGSRNSNRPASNAGPPSNDIPVFICHQQPRNEAATENGEEGAEVIALEIIEQESSA